MNERIKELAEQAGLYYEDTITDEEYDIAIERFAELVRQDEREACAKLCEDMSNTEANMNKTWRNAANDCAAAIRARGEK
jgi:hypothetical protein